VRRGSAGHRLAPDKIIAAVRKGHQVLESIHQNVDVSPMRLLHCYD
jgi:hypothetical protein